MLQAKLDRSGKQEQEQNSPNLGTTFYPSPVLLKLNQILLSHSGFATYPEVVGVEDAISSDGLVQLAPRLHPVQLDQPVEVLVAREHRALFTEVFLPRNLKCLIPNSVPKLNLT